MTTRFIIDVSEHNEAPPSRPSQPTHRFTVYASGPGPAASKAITEYRERRTRTRERPRWYTLTIADMTA